MLLTSLLSRQKLKIVVGVLVSDEACGLLVGSRITILNKFRHSRAFLCSCAIEVGMVIDEGVQTSSQTSIKIEDMKGNPEVVRCGCIHSCCTSKYLH